MAKRKDSEPTTTPEATPATATALPVTPDAPLTVETPKLAAMIEPAKIELPTLELPKIELPKVDLPVREMPKAEPSVAAAATEPTLAALPEMTRTPLHRFALAASLAGAAVLGALAGAAATAALQPSTPVPAANAPDETRALRETVVRLSSEVTTLKAGIDAANRNTAAQLARLAERFDRAEKAQVEPAAKLAKIADSLDRLERRPAVAAATAATPEATGSVTTVEKQQGKPPVAEGWRLREFYAGRALVESRNGDLYEVGPGSNLPGLGKVETIKREDGKVVVVTPKGVITSSLEQRRGTPYHFGPYRY